MILGVDYASHQGADMDFAALAAGGYSFATGKVTGGNQYANPYFSTQFANAGKAGLVRGIYHYDAEPTVSTGTPSEEAAHFLRHLPDPLPDWTHLALDAEERATRDVARYLTWLRTVRDATKTRPFFYTFPSFISEASNLPWSDLAEFPLWFAWYPNDASNIAQHAMPTAPAGWRRVTIWQYTGGSPVPGTSFPTDLNRFDGTVDELRALGKPGDLSSEAVTPAPAMKSEPATVRCYLNDRHETILEVNFGGYADSIDGYVVQDAGVSVRHGSDIYDRTLRMPDGFLPWTKRGQ